MWLADRETAFPSPSSFPPGGLTYCHLPLPLKPVQLCRDELKSAGRSFGELKVLAVPLASWVAFNTLMTLCESQFCHL